MIVFFFVVVCVFAGNSPNLRMRRGYKTTIDLYPFVVSILTVDDYLSSLSNETWKLLCGGTIITSHAVLTSGFCANTLIQNVVQMDDVVVRGNTELWKCECQRTRDHSLSGFAAHPNFKQHTYEDNETIYENDVGIIKVIEGFTGLYEIPISYRDGHKYWNAKQSYRIMDTLGWGIWDESTPFQPAERLQLSYLDVFSTRKCNKIYKNRLVKNIFCASMSKNVDGGPCLFDYGGPAVGYLNSTGFLIGIISSGVGCVKKPTLYTNISSFIPWIAENIGDDADPNDWY